MLNMEGVVNDYLHRYCVVLNVHRRVCTIYKSSLAYFGLTTIFYMTCTGVIIIVVSAE